MASREPPSPRSLGWFPSCFLDEGFDAHRVWEPAFQKLSARDANSIAEGIIAAAASTEVSLDLSEASFEVDQALTELLYSTFPKEPKPAILLLCSLFPHLLLLFFFSLLDRIGELTFFDRPPFPSQLLE